MTTYSERKQAPPLLLICVAVLVLVTLVFALFNSEDDLNKHGVTQEEYEEIMDDAGTGSGHDPSDDCFMEESRKTHLVQQWDIRG